jgi:antitoxin component of MazEF toxin-antitoxin module
MRDQRLKNPAQLRLNSDIDGTKRSCGMAICRHRDYMPELALKIVKIGNSRGVRFPAKWLAKYRLGETVLADVRPDGVWLHAAANEALSWEATAAAMAKANVAVGDEFADMAATQTDGLDQLDA